MKVRASAVTRDRERLDRMSGSGFQSLFSFAMDGSDRNNNANGPRCIVVNG
jgi:hypothetical protein